MIIANEQQLLSFVSTELPSVQNVLVLAPHPDDEVFGCCGVLVRLKQSGAKITVVILTDGALGGDNNDGCLPRRRAEESCAAAKILELNAPSFWGLPDRGIVYGESLIERLAKTMDETGAELVFLPSPADWHPDHQTLAFAGAEAARRLGKGLQIAFYEISDPLPCPSLLLDISQVTALKKQAMQCFVSQFGEQPYLERIEGINRFRATHLGPTVESAEAFLLLPAAELEKGLPQLLEGPLSRRRMLGFAGGAHDLPLVSVIVRSMDRPTLDKALDSIMYQTWPNIEIVLVNAKGPGHRPMPATWGRLPLRIVGTGAQLGRTRAANLGLDAARGEYLMFLDDDDWFDADHVAKLLEALRRQPAFRLAYTGTRCIDEQSQLLPETLCHPYDEIRLLAGNLIPIHAALFSKTLLANGCRFDESFDLYEDWDFWLQVSEQTAFLQVDGCSAVYRIDRKAGSGVHAKDAAVHQATLAVFRKWFNHMDDARRLKMIDALQQGYAQKLRLAALEPRLVERDKHIAHLTQTLETLEAQKTQALNAYVVQLDQLQLTLSERDHQINQLQQTLTSHDIQRAEQQRLAEERQTVLVQTQSALAQTSHALHSLEARLAKTDKEMERILNSHSFKLTRPLRLLRRRIQQAQHVSQLAQRYVDRRGGWLRGAPKLVARSWEILARGGVSGFAGRLKDYARISTQASYASSTPTGTGHLTRLPKSPGQLPEIQPVDYRFWKSYVLPCTVDVVVCVHNALEDVQRCLSSVIQHSAHCRLILVDDGSREDTRDFLREFANDQGATLLRNETAGGYTRAANQGLRASTGGYVVLLNSDTIVTPGWIEKLVVCAESNPRIGLVGPLSNTASWQSIPELEEEGDWATNPLPDGISVTEFSGLVAKHSAHSYPHMAFLNGFCLMIRRALIDDIGIFDEEAFGRGYGEENDYCLRARAAGWQLALADNAYVFHAQSKSYSHEKRKLLAERAGEQLAAKHGSAVIIDGVEQCRWDRQLLALRSHARVMLERERTIAQACRYWEGRRILFVLPIMHAGGGGNVIITEARAMMRMGVAVTLANLSVHKQAFEKSYPDLDIPVRYLDSSCEVVTLGLDFDAVIATAYHSVEWIAPLAAVSEGPVLGYYVQDFEPYFFAPGTHSHEAAYRSYSLVPGIRLFTKTQWNRDLVFQETGMQAEIVGPSVDIDLFFPQVSLPVQRNHRVKVVAMVRPSTPRRNPEGTITVLGRLRQIFNDRIDIEIFGPEDEGEPLPAGAENLNLVNHGQLRPAQTAYLLGSADIFIDMSHFQAMGLTAMESMACGAIPVIPCAGGASSFAQHDSNAVIVDTRNTESVVDTVSALINDFDKRRTLQFEALNTIVQHYPEKAAFAILRCLFPRQEMS